MNNTEQRKIVGQITIDIYDDMNVTVRNFPTNHQAALVVMSNALLSVADFFIRGAQEPRRSDILRAKPNIIVPPIDLSKIQGVGNG